MAKNEITNSFTSKYGKLKIANPHIMGFCESIDIPEGHTVYHFELHDHIKKLLSDGQTEILVHAKSEEEAIGYIEKTLRSIKLT
jgi:hypothetical protein